MKYRYVLFDLDGTLLDTSPGIISAVKRMITDRALSPIPEETLFTFIGPPIEVSLKAYYNLTDDSASDLAGTFRRHYASEEYLFMAEPYQDLFSLLRELRDAGVQIAVATNKRHDYAIHLLEYSGIAAYCDIMHGTDSFEKTDKKSVILRCLKDFPVNKPGECVLVGDTVHDADGARQAGISFIGVTYGFGFRTGDDIPANCAGLAGNMEELRKLLLELK